jgi:glycosyltransferase involved in cell wall biosynthesis
LDGEAAMKEPSFDDHQSHRVGQDIALVSVIVPAYNAAQFIERTLRSAMAQTYTRLEILVVNDGSTDQTGSIVQSLAGEDPRIRQIAMANRGVAHARNNGIAQSKGEFLAFLDADDLWHPTKVELQVASLCGDHGMQFSASYAFHRTIDVSDRIVAHPRAVACSGYIFSRHLFKKFVGNGSSLMVRHECAVAVGGFDGSYRDRRRGGCEDLDFELKLAARMKIVAVPRYLIGHRRYEGNMSSDRSRMAASLVATITNHIAANPKLPSHARRYALAAAYEWSGRQLRASGDYAGAVWCLARVPVLDPLRGTFMIFMGLRNLAVALGRLARPAQRPPISAPTFQTMDPSEIGPGPNALELRRLTQLAKVDAGLFGDSSTPRS